MTKTTFWKTMAVIAAVLAIGLTFQSCGGGRVKTDPGAGVAMAPAAARLLPPHQYPVSGLSWVGSPFHRAQRDATLRYGRLRMARISGEGSPSNSVALGRDAYINVVSHNSYGRFGATFFKRYQTMEERRGPALTNRLALAQFDAAGIMVLATGTYQEFVGKALAVHADDYFATWGRILDPRTREPWEDVLQTLPDGNSVMLREPATPEKLAAAYSYGGLSLDAPFTLEFAKACMRFDVGNGAAGNYWDCGSYNINADYSRHAVANFRRWLAGQITDAEAQRRFGKPIAALTPPPMTTEEKPKLYCLVPDELDRTLLGPASDEHVDPLLPSWVHYRIARNAEFQHRLHAFGETLSDGYVNCFTYYVDEGGPQLAAFASGFTAEEVIDQGRGYSYGLWEAIFAAPHRGFARGESRENLGSLKLMLDHKWEPYLHPEIYGRKTATSFLKYATEASAPAPLAYKAQLDTASRLPAEVLPLEMLCFAENWANLSCQRAQFGRKDPIFPAVARMNRFQSEHEDLFLGARRYDRLGVWCSVQQSWNKRYDWSLAVSRMLTDAGIEHRVINDRTINENALTDLDCLVIAQDRLVTDHQIQVLNAFARRPGKGLVLIGKCADRDEWDQDRPDALPQLTAGVPADHIAVIGPNVYPRLPQTGGYRIAGLGDDLEPLRRAVLPLCGRTLTFRAPPQSFVEIHPVQIDRVEGGSDPGKRRTVVHVVNYDVSMRGKTGVSDPIELLVKLPEDARPADATCYFPCEEGVPTKRLAVEVVRQEGMTYGKLTVPPVRIYALIALTYR